MHSAPTLAVMQPPPPSFAGAYDDTTGEDVRAIAYGAVAGVDHCGRPVGSDGTVGPPFPPIQGTPVLAAMHPPRPRNERPTDGGVSVGTLLSLEREAWSMGCVVKR